MMAPRERKRKTTTSEEEKALRTKRPRRHQLIEDNGVGESVLGGLSGGYRLSGEEEEERGAASFKVSFNDKAIICMRCGDGHGDTNAKPALVFTHGAGGGIANPATRDFVTGAGREAPAVCFQGTMNLPSRVKSFHAVIDDVGGGVRALGGRSMGARAAVVAAQETEIDITELLLVSYPLVGGKNADMRDQILLDIPAAVEVLFVIGSKDSMCSIELLDEVRDKMKSRSWLLEIEGADHGMSLRDKTGMEALRKKSGAISGKWLHDRDPDKRYCHLRWDSEAQRVEGGEWQRPRAGATTKTEVVSIKEKKKKKTKKKH